MPPISVWPTRSSGCDRLSGTWRSMYAGVLRSATYAVKAVQAFCQLILVISACRYKSLKLFTISPRTKIMKRSKLRDTT